MVEVDPDIVEAEWLRGIAEGSRVLVNPVWREGGKCQPYTYLAYQGVFSLRGADSTCWMLLVFDVEEFQESPRRIKFTLKDIDDLYGILPAPHLVY